MENNRLVRMTFGAKVDVGRSRGRSRHTWKDEIQECYAKKALECSRRELVEDREALSRLNRKIPTLGAR